ncbi:MAG: hypothetical protein ACM37W_21260 [Actinomycetota bacterium]
MGLEPVAIGLIHLFSDSLGGLISDRSLRRGAIAPTFSLSMMENGSL